jgi:hypothetical protein
MCRLAKRSKWNRSPRAPRRWRSIAWLESLGLLPAFADRLELKFAAARRKPPPMPIAEWTAVRDTLATFWRPARHDDGRHGPAARFHRPARFGKTTALCKWMTAAVLREEHRAASGGWTARRRTPRNFSRCTAK